MQTKNTLNEKETQRKYIFTIQILVSQQVGLTLNTVFWSNKLRLTEQGQKFAGGENTRLSNEQTRVKSPKN